MKHNFFCFGCEQTFVYEWKNRIKFKNNYGSFDGIVCPICGQHAKVIGKKVSIVNTADIPYSIAVDKFGKEYELNKKGKVIGSAHRKYENDSRGWKRAGYKISPIDEHNKKVNYH